MILAFKIEFPEEIEGGINIISSFTPDLTKALSLDCFLEGI